MYNAEIWIVFLAVSEESLIFQIYIRKKLCYLQRFGLLIKGPGGFDSWKKIDKKSRDTAPFKVGS